MSENSKNLNNSAFCIRHSTFKRAFTLVELMIVVSILGILAAIVLPEFQGHQQKAKEAAAKANLKLLRDAIERYAADHGVPPGYPSNNASMPPAWVFFRQQMIDNKQYLTRMPTNPFNSLSTMHVTSNQNQIPESLGLFGWEYKPLQKIIRLDYPGTDSEGIKYTDY